MKTGHRKYSKMMYGTVSAKDGWYRMSLRTDDPALAEVRLSQMRRLSEAGMTIEEIKSRLDWLPFGRCKPTEESVQQITFRQLVEKITPVLQVDYPRSFKGFHQPCLAHLLKFFGDATLDKITVDHAEGYKVSRARQITKRKKPVSKSTLNKELRLLRYTFRFAEARGYAKHNPVHGLKFFKEPKGRIRFLSKAEIEKFLPICVVWFKPIAITLIVRKR